ncbi:cardiolipin synthase [Christensenellaceae bacterium OttesenSCG-928-M15]|nr:cardiolipin synthase [Christensenellaceae bacterium OttesenSCG-928-M15]
MSKQKKADPIIASVLRIVLVACVILLQLLLIILLVQLLRNKAIYVYLAIEVIALINIFALVNRSRNSAFTIAWMMIIFFLPVFGFLLYRLWGRQGTSGKKYDKLRVSIAYANTMRKTSSDAQQHLFSKHPSRKRFSAFLNQEGYPVYENTSCTYYPLGEQQFDAILEDMEKAEKFIFLEYYILHSGDLFDRISAILKKKAAQGLEIRIMYDDWGNLLSVPADLEELKQAGVQIVCYNPIHKYISKLYINYRNHQKVTVIDGNIGYTGGTNIADEYVNIHSKVGHFKDTGIRLEGEAVWSLTTIFLQMWDGETGEHSEYTRYAPTITKESNGFIQPYADGPLKRVGKPTEVMYRSMISNAREYLYLSTPYLVIDNTMTETLCTAAISGVDVRLVVPKICDHWPVHMVTQSNYGALLKAGVRIYEYTPGFIHAKTMLSDDEHAITGSINMDYRSFYFHFENGVWICGSPVIKDIKQDFLDTILLSSEVFYKDWRKRPFHIRMAQGFFRLFSVML